MKIKPALLLLSLSVFCLLSRPAFADTLTLTGAPAGTTDGIDIYPYQFTVTGPGGTNTLVDLSCLNFNREVSFGETWTVDVYNVLNIPTADLGGFTETQYLADALLYNQYAAAANNPTLTSELQFAIWSIMDPTDVNASSSYDNAGAFDATAQTLAANALAEVATAPPSVYVHDIVFLPDASNETGWTNGVPQIFMADATPPAVTPEPAGIVLLGTGMFGAVLFARRKFLHS